LYLMHPVELYKRLYYVLYAIHDLAFRFWSWSWSQVI